MTPPKVDEEYKDKIRDSIIIRSMMLFSEKGFFQTRMDDVVTKRISKGTIYNYFNSKTELFLACQERWRKIWNQGSNFPSINQLNATESFAQYIKVLIKTIGGEPIEHKKASFETIGIAINHSDKQIFETLKENEKNFLKVTQEMIKKGKTSGEFKSGLDDEFLSEMLISFVGGMQLLSLLLDKECNWDKMADLLVKWLLEEVKK
jgi:AcrR family transcriptional regulator